MRVIIADFAERKDQPKATGDVTEWPKVLPC